MSRRRHRRWALAAAVVALLAAATAGADDRDFLRERAAKPNILILLDTSGSMVGTSEVASEFTLGDGAPPIDFGMLPGGGDDPRSRMGIAKAVLRNFLTSVTEANFALGGYQYELPDAGAGSPLNAFPAHHWTYQATASDRFGFLEQGYAYRVGWAQKTPNLPTLPRPLINPADFAEDFLFGYNPYFSPDSSSGSYVAPSQRYGPILAPTLHEGNPYDLLPIYLMRNCESEAIDGGSKACGLRVFPYYTYLDRSGTKRDELWAYQFRNCTPGAVVAGDDGCSPYWESDLVAGVSVTQWARRAHLEVPTADPSGNPNHPIGEDTAGAMVGNREVADSGAEDYDLDGSNDLDYDGDATWDWLMRVDLVEQRNFRTCDMPEPSPTFTPTFTPSDTPTNTPTFTNTPLPPPVCADLEIGNLYYLDNNRVRINVVRNNNPWHQAVHRRTDIAWEDLYDPAQYLNFMNFNQIVVYYQTPDDYTPPTVATVDVNFPPGQQTEFTTRWDGIPGGSYVAGTTTVTFTFEFPGYGLTCTETRSVTRTPPTPTMTPTPVVVYCSDIQVSGLAPTLSGSYSTWGLYQASVVNGTGVPIEIQETRFDWFKLRGNWFVDWYALNSSMADPPDSSWYWGGPNGAVPDDSATPSVQATTNPPGARLAGGETRAWTADIDGNGASGTDMTYGDWGVCLEFVVVSGVPFADSGATCVQCDQYLGSWTPTPEPTRTPSNTPTITPTFTQTNTFTLTYTPTNTITPSITYTPSNTLTPSNTYTPSNTVTATRTFTPSNTATNTATRTNTATATQTYTPSRTYTPSNTATSTRTFTPTNTATNTATFTRTYTPSNTATATRTFTPTNTATNTATFTPTNTPTNTATNTLTPTNTPTATFTPTPTEIEY